MSEPTRLRVLTRIAGCLLLVSALHYALDEPTRSSPVAQSAFAQTNRALLLLTKSKPAASSATASIVTHRPFFDHMSFEQWEGQPNSVLSGWFSQVTIDVSEVVKQETEIVRHGRSAVRLEHDGVGHCGNVRQELPPEYILWLRGRQLKFSAWALSATPGAPCLHIKINDEPLYEPVHSTACLQDPSGTWQLVTVERTIGPEATRIVAIIDISREVMGETVAWVYVDNTSLTASPPSGVESDIP